MKYILSFVLSILFFACNPPQEKKEAAGEILAETIIQKEEVHPETSKKEASIPQAKKIKLDSVLSEELDDYLTDLREGVLGLCCHDGLVVQLNYDYFEKSIEMFDVNGLKKEREVYQGGNSFFKRYFNDHPKVMGWDLSGRIVDNEAILNGNIRIGMSKTELLTQLYETSPLFKEIIQLDISTDEMGDTYTSFRFDGDSLKEILFE
ncbi:MAG: hypothetical protein AAFR87_14025 [Bacteroidota bacterium]